MINILNLPRLIINNEHTLKKLIKIWYIYIINKK